MEGLVKGDVVFVHFPFSDLTALKKRPALVAATLEGDDVVLCQITSKGVLDRYSLLLTKLDFKQGKLPVISRIRPNKLFTAHKSLILYKIGIVNETIIKAAEEKIIKMFTNG